MDERPYRRPDVPGRSAGASGARRPSSPSPRAPRGAREGGESRFAQAGRDAGNARPAQGGRGGASRYRQVERGNASYGRDRREPPRAARPAPRRRRRDPASIIVPIVICAALLAAIVYVGSCWLISTVNRSTYCSNIYINGIDISPYSKEEGKEVVRQQIAERLSAVHELKWQGDSWSFSAEDFGATIETDAVMERAWNIGHVGTIFDRIGAIRELKRNPIYLDAPIRYSEEQVDSFVSSIYDKLYVAPQDAQVVADMNSPYLASEATEGQELDRETARAQIVSLLETGEGSEVLPVLSLEPALSTEQALSSLDMIVEYRTDTTARGYYGRFNVRKGLMCFYGLIVQPGEEVSFNDVVGPRNEERGWQPGTEYIGGGKTQEGYGGGICQASSTLYGAVLKAGMTILERHPHSMTVAYVDPSIDAAVTNTSKDLRFRNDTENAITIYTEVDKEWATVRIYGARPKYRYELESRIVSQDSGAIRSAYVDDVEGTHCYYTDEVALYSEGHAACRSEGWVIGYDWNTGEKMEEKQLSYDSYESGYNLYWRGVHPRDGSDAAASASPEPGNN